MKLTPEQKEVHDFQLKNFDHDAYLAGQVDIEEEEEEGDRTADDYADYSYASIDYGD